MIRVQLLLILVGIIIAQAKEYQLPLKLNMTDIGCDYIEHFEFTLADYTAQVIGQFNSTGGFYQLSGFKDYQAVVDNKLHACDIHYTTWQYSIKQMRLYRKAQNLIIVEQDAQLQNAQSQELELQLIFEQTQYDLQSNQELADRKTAVVSVFFTTGYSGIQSHLPDGIDMLLPFTQINRKKPTQQFNVDVNPDRQLDAIQRYFFQYMTFVGKDGDKQQNIYFNRKKFYVPQSFVNTFFGPSEEYQNIPNSNPTAVSQDEMDQEMVKICYGTLEETVLRQNYAVWLWIVGLLVWWIVMVCTENDTESVFLEEYKDNRLTMIPLYSMYKLNNDIFFSKLSRQSHYLLYFAWEVLIISILYGQFHLDRTYEVGDAIILWYGIVAIVLAWPVGYFFGWIVFTAREQHKEKIKLEIDYKQITTKTSPEAEKLHAAILDEENRMYTTWYVYYGFMFLALWACVLISIWMMKFVDADTSGYWVATIFVMIFMDQIVLDSIVPFLPLIGSVQKYRGYWYDAELASLWKHREEL
ncbi:unnamed protein product [Paramecium octaurelia]|uniref:Uncharacterized protein n=1 Tax=Paramecium octaurelia TaxID=43137 RepID=A0A8S1URH1_PAROT|nr:unnamed protein product [Paramecium octaurelia]